MFIQPWSFQPCVSACVSTPPPYPIGCVLPCVSTPYQYLQLVYCFSFAAYSTTARQTLVFCIDTFAILKISTHPFLQTLAISSLCIDLCINVYIILKLSFPRRPIDTTDNKNNFDDWKERNWCWLLADGKIRNVVFQRRKYSEVVCSSKSEYGTTTSMSLAGANTADTDTDNVESRAENNTKKTLYKKRHHPQQQRSLKRHRCCRPSSTSVATTPRSSINSDSNGPISTATAINEINANNTTNPIGTKEMAADDTNVHRYVGWVNDNWCWLLPSEREAKNGVMLLETDIDIEHEFWKTPPRGSS